MKNLRFSMAAALVIVSLLSSGILTCKAAPAKAMTLIYSHGYPTGKPEHPYLTHMDALLFKKYTEQYTDGRVQVKIYPAGQLFSTKDEIEACRRGDVHVVLTPGAYSGMHNKLELFRDNFPVLTSVEQVKKWATNPDIYEMNRKMYEEKVGGLRFLGYVPTPVYKLLWTKKPITKIADFQGLKIRAGSKQKDMFARLGVSVQLIASGELITAIQTGMVDGVYMTWSWGKTNSLWQFLPYASPRGMAPFSSFIGEPLNINKKTWDEISPKDQKTLLEKVVPKMGEGMLDHFGKEEDFAFQEFEKNGLKFNWLSGAELAQLESIIAEEVEKAMDKIGIREYYEFVKKVKK